MPVVNSWMKNLARTYTGLPMAVYILFVARIINRAGGFVHTLLVLFLSDYMEMSGSRIGNFILLMGLAEFAGAFLGGKLADRVSRKRVFIFAQSAAAVFFIPCGFMISFNMQLIPYLVATSMLFSAMVYPVSQAMTTDLVSKEKRKAAYSLLYLGINIGVSFGPFIAVALYKNHLQWFFWGDALTTFMAVVLVGMLVKEKVLTQEDIDAIPEEDMEHKESGNALRAVLKRPLLAGFMFFSIFIAMVYAQVGFAFPLQIKAVFDEGFLAFLMAFNAVVVLVFTGILSYTTSRFRPIVNMTVSALLLGAGMGMMVFIDTKYLFVLSVFVWTLGEIQMVTNSGVFVMAHTPITHRARFIGLQSIIYGIGSIISPKIAGIMIENKGMAFLWQAVAVCGLIAASGFAIIATKDRKKGV